MGTRWYYGKLLTFWFVKVNLGNKFHFLLHHYYSIYVYDLNIRLLSNFFKRLLFSFLFATPKNDCSKKFLKKSLYICQNGMNILWLLIVVTAQSGKCSILNVLLFFFSVFRRTREARREWQARRGRPWGREWWDRRRKCQKCLTF